MAKRKLQTKKKVQAKKRVQIKKKVVKSKETKKREEVKFIGQVTRIRQTEPATVVEWPRTITHFHTYGMLSPFFEGLKKGELRATRCSNPKCAEKRLWIPPRAHCPDCHTEMIWKTLSQSCDREDLCFHPSRLCWHRHRTFYPLLAGGCGNPGSCNDPEKLSPLWGTTHRNEGESRV